MKTKSILTKPNRKCKNKCKNQTKKSMISNYPTINSIKNIKSVGKNIQKRFSTYYKEKKNQIVRQ